MGRDFLLPNKTAERLYRTAAKNLPIIDYHSHIPAREIAENIRFSNLTEAWLKADHYKWRAMRACGVDENRITGGADDYEKFLAYAACLPKLTANPLYHWSHLELQKYCGIDTPLSEKTASDIWGRARAALSTLSVRDIFALSNVETICTTDDPADSLEYHRQIRQSGIKTAVLPAFRPDKALHIQKQDYQVYIKQLSEAAELPVTSFAQLKFALLSRLDAFCEAGCRAADHGFGDFPFLPAGEEAAAEIFEKALGGETPDARGAVVFQTELMLALAREYRQRGLVMEIHYGALRNVNSKMFGQLGADTGFDIIGKGGCIDALAKFLDALEQNDALPRTLLFSLHPGDNAALCALAGAFGSSVQQGSAWWFSDTLHGMREQLGIYASMLPLGGFCGFLTDSRSLLSYTRHEYFRRLFCGYVGGLVENGEYPDDPEALEALIHDVCYGNAKNFFGF
jgi:glucuronate isomerase